MGIVIFKSVTLPPLSFSIYAGVHSLHVLSKKVLHIEYYSFYSNEFALISKHQTRNMAVVNNHVFVLLV